MADDLVVRRREPASELPAPPLAKGAKALQLALSYIEQADAAGTRRVYASDWRHFNAWALAAGFKPLPAVLTLPRRSGPPVM